MPNIMRGYKALDSNFRCRGFQYRVGETARCPKAEMCREGFHFCPRALDCLKYYRLDESRFAEVEARDPTVKDDKAVTTELHIVREIPREEFAAMCTGTIRGKDPWGPCESTYHLGKLHGPHHAWHVYGTLREYMMYANGERHGPCKSWDRYGVQRSDDTYVHGQRHGVSRTWHETGLLYCKCEYVNGELYREIFV